MFAWRIDTELALGLVDLRYAQDIFLLVDRSRSYLREWLPWLDATRSVGDYESFIKRSLLDYAERRSVTTVILYNNEVVGVASIHRIDPINKIAEIGYWLGVTSQGKGIMTRVCRALTDYALTDLHMNKVEIHVAKENLKNRRIPERLGFTQEGMIRQAEWLYDHFVDHIVYGMLASEWGM